MNSNSGWKPFSSLYGFIRLILIVDWDLIGIFGFPGALSEYDHYAEEVYRLVTEDATIYEVIRYLVELQMNRIEMSVNQEILKTVVDKIFHVADVHKQSQELTTK